MTLFLVCTIPFWTSNVIRMISWIPLLGRNGLVNQTLMHAHLINAPLEWLLYSPFSVALAFVHLFTFFMVVPIFNSMMRIDRSLIEAAYDAGASAWQTLWNVIIPLCEAGHRDRLDLRGDDRDGRLHHLRRDGRPADRFGRQGRSRRGSNALQFPPAAANAVILLAVTLLIIVALNRIVDVRKEL